MAFGEDAAGRVGEVLRSFDTPDLLHLATALYAAESPGDMAFLTLDERQREVAAAVGFQTAF